MQGRAIFVIGGTGMGKTKLGVQLAERFSGEVINSDAMQLYRALGIATAQPTEEEKRGIPHHLMGILDAHEAWTVRDYRDSALKIMQDIWSRGKTPIVVGGTLYYVQSLIWKALADEQGAEPSPGKKIALPPVAEGETPFQRLQRLDPLRAQQLHPNDARKIERSLELLEEGKQCVAQPDSTNALDQVRLLNCRILWVHCEEEKEMESILAARVEQMLAQGLVKEVDDFMLANKDVNMTRGVFQAIGIRDHDMLVVRHRQYVKSQLKWIRKRILPRTVPVHCLAFASRADWDAKVSAPALAISQAFLEENCSASELETKFPTCNTRAETSPVPDSKIARTCEICNNRVFVGDEVWNKHIAGRSHQRNAQKNKQQEQKKLKREEEEEAS